MAPWGRDWELTTARSQPTNSPRRGAPARRVISSHIWTAAARGRAVALRYLLQYLDCSGEASGEIGLCTLLLGYNSTASLTIQASIESLVHGVIEANQKFAEAT